MPSKKYLLVPALAAALLGAGTFGTVTSAHAHGYCDGPGGGYGPHRGYQQGYNAPATYQDERGNYRAGEPTNLTKAAQGLHEAHGQVQCQGRTLA